MLSYLYHAFVKVAFLLLLLALWDGIAEPYAHEMKLVGQWFLAQYAYPFFPRQLFLTVTQVAILVSSFRILMWILDTEKEVESTGFSSKKI